MAVRARHRGVVLEAQGVAVLHVAFVKAEDVGVVGEELPGRLLGFGPLHTGREEAIRVHPGLRRSEVVPAHRAAQLPGGARLRRGRPYASRAVVHVRLVLVGLHVLLGQVLDVDLGAGGRRAEQAEAGEGQRRQNRHGDGPR